MIKESDIDLYLEAKRQVNIGRKVVIVCIVSLIGWIGLRILGIDSIYLDIAAGAVVIAGLVHADGGRFNSYITKAKLLEVIERQINSDPDAIKYINRT